MKAKRILSIIVVMTSVLVFRPPAAKGTLVTIQIEAVVDYVMDEGNYLEGKIKPDDTITGFYIYDSTTPDSNPSVHVGDYEHQSPPHGMFLSVGGIDFKTDPTNVDFLVEIVNNNAGLDAFFLRSYNNCSLLNGTSVDNIEWLLVDPTESALSSIALFTGTPVLGKWPENLVLISGPIRAEEFVINAHVTSVELIPEPATVLLLGLGGLFLRRKT